jgi:MFS family permease
MTASPAAGDQQPAEPAPLEPAGSRRNPLRSLRVRNYRLYFFGQLVSLTGSWAQQIAQDWLVLRLTNSGTALGIVTALQFGPALLLSLYGGALADRGDKRRLMLATQTGLALTALTLGLLDISGVVRIWQVMLLAAVLGVFTALDSPIRQSFVIEIVGPADLPNAVALNSTTFNLARIVGPAVSGVVIAAFGTGWAFIGNAVSSIAVLAGLALMRTAELFPAPPVDRAPGQYRAALRYVRNRSDLLLPMLLMLLLGTFGYNYQITIALIAKQVFHSQADTFGLLSTCLAIGAVAGALAASLRRHRPSQLFLLVAATTFGLTELLAGAMPSFGLTALALVPAGFTMITMAQAANATLQLGVEPTMRGRVMGLYVLCFMGGTPFGAPIVGWVAEVLGPRWGMLGGALLCLLGTAMIAGWLGRRRQLGLAGLRGRPDDLRDQLDLLRR